MKNRIWVLLFLSLLLAGCGNDNDFGSPSGSADTGERPSPLLPITGRIVPPQPGFPLSSLQVENSNGSAAISALGEFSISDLAPNGGQLMLVLDAGGNIVYAAFQKDGQEVGPRTTAQVLLFFATGGYALPPNLYASYREQLFNLPELDELEASITQALAADPAGLLSSSNVLETLRAAIASMKARAGVPQTSNRLLIDPSNEQSGIAPSERGANQLIVTNSFRRPAWAYVTKVATTDGEGLETPVSPPVAVTDFEVPAVKGAASFASAATDAAIVVYGDLGLGDLRSGPLAGEPVTTRPINLPSEDGVSIKYSLEVIGPGLSAPSPTDANQRQKLRELTLNYGGQMMLQFLFNVVLNAPAVSDRIDALSSQTDFSLVVSDFVKLLVNLKPDLADKAAAGDLDGVLESMYNIVTSPTSEALILNFLVERAAPAVGLNFSGSDSSKFFNAFRKLVNVLNTVDLVLTSADTAFAGGSIAGASRHVQFDVKTLAARVRLTPLNPRLEIDDEQQFTATVPSVTLEQNQFLEFHWRCGGNSGTLRAPTGSMVNDFTTSQTIGPIYTAEDEGTDTIEVTVTLVDVGENIETELGTASTTVTVEAEPENLLVNGDFSEGLSSWSFTTVNEGFFSGYPRYAVETVERFLPSQDGNPYFSMDVPGAAAGYLEQSLTLPDGVESIRLRYRVWGAHDPVNAYASANGLVDAFTPARLETSPGATDETRSLDITSLQGQTVSIRIGGSSSGSNGTVVKFDDVAVLVVR